MLGVHGLLRLCAGAVDPEDDTREALMVTPLWFVLLGAGWLFAGKKRLAK